MGIRSEMVAVAKSRGICTQCMKLKAKVGFKQCSRCIKTNKRKREARERERCPTCGRAMPLLEKAKPNTRTQSREARRKVERESRRRNLTNKVRKLDRIKHAVDAGKPV